MDAKQIDEVFDALRNSDLYRILEMIGIEVEEENIFAFWNQNVNQIMKKIGNKIKKGDYEYFLSKKNENGVSNPDFWSIYLAFAEEQEIKKIIENEKQLEELKEMGFFIPHIVNAVNDSEYIKQLIERREELDISGMELVELIVKTKDSEYIKEKIQENLVISVYELGELLVATNDAEFIKSYIYDNEYLSIRPKLILATHDPKFIKGILESKEKVKELSLDSIETAFSLPGLILATNDVEFIKEIINDREKRGYLRLGTYEFVSLLKSLKDSEFIKEIINDEMKLKTLKINNNALVELILATNDVNFIKDIINNKAEKYRFNESNITKLRTEIGDVDYLNQLLEKMESQDDIQTRSCIILPKNMTIGIEIESEGIYSQLIKKVGEKILPSRLGM